MSWLDPFRNLRKPKTTGPPAGRSGRAHTDGFLELEELNLDLQGLSGLRIYDEMWRTHADVRRSLSMVCNPLIAGTWTVEPYGGDEADEKALEHAEFVRWWLFDFLRPGFKLHLAEAVPLFTRAGFAPFEVIWRAGTWNGRPILAPRKLDVRLPRTIQRWFEDELGDLTEIEQFVAADPARVRAGLESGLVRIKAQDLVYYRVGAEGNNWEGVSLLRPAYRHWYILEKIERLDAIAQERESTGIPVVYPPANKADDPVLDDIAAELAKLKAGEEAWIIMPGPHAQDLSENAAVEGWRLDILGFSGGSGGSTRDPTKSMSYHRDAIAAAVVAEFMRLGQAGEGARATADVQQDPFYAGVEALADIVLSPWNDELIPRLIALNFDDADGAPRVVMDNADSTSLSDLASFVQNLVSAQALVPDPPLEDWLRERGGMPPADPEERARREQERDEDRELDVASREKDLAADDGAQPPKNPKQKAKAKTAAGRGGDTFRRGSRELRDWEQQISLDDIEDALEGAKERLVSAGREAAFALAREITGQLAAEQPVRVDHTDLEDAIADELGALYELGRQTVANELALQGADRRVYSFDREDIEAGAIRRRARIAARAITSRIVQTIARLVLGGRKTTYELHQAAETEALAGLKAEAQVNAAPVLNLGRADEADSRANEIRGSRYTSILDANRCEPCAHADDDVLRPLTDPVRLRHRPPNPDCYGGDRCRCIEFFELRREAAPSFAGEDPDAFEWRKLL